MTTDTAGFPRDALSARYPLLHDVWEYTEDVCYAIGHDHGRADGRREGYAAGWEDGFAAGFLVPDPPQAGSPLANALERAALRDALCPGAETLAEAVAAFIRDMDRKRARERDRAAAVDAHHNRNYGVVHNAQSVLGSLPDVPHCTCLAVPCICGRWKPDHPGAWSR